MDVSTPPIRALQHAYTALPHSEQGCLSESICAIFRLFSIRVARSFPPFAGVARRFPSGPSYRLMMILLFVGNPLGESRFSRILAPDRVWSPSIGKQGLRTYERREDINGDEDRG